jgi:hypothetical protein
MIKKSAIISLFLVVFTMSWIQYTNGQRPILAPQIIVDTEYIEISKIKSSGNKFENNTSTTLARAEIIPVSNDTNDQNKNEIIKIKLPPGKRLYNEEKMEEVARSANIETHYRDNEENSTN